MLTHGWTHTTKDDCEQTIRASNGRVFCKIDPSQLQHFPKVTEQYLKCLNILRSDEEDFDDYLYVDAYGWLAGSFHSLLTQLATSPPQPEPTKSTTPFQYLLAPYFKCILKAIGDTRELYPGLDG